MERDMRNKRGSRSHLHIEGADRRAEKAECRERRKEKRGGGSDRRRKGAREKHVRRQHQIQKTGQGKNE